MHCHPLYPTKTEMVRKSERASLLVTFVFLDLDSQEEAFVCPDSGRSEVVFSSLDSDSSAVAFCDQGLGST